MAVLLLTFVTAVLAATLVAVFLTTAANVRERVAEELDIGAGVITEIIARRTRQLADTAQVLADDFAFREAVATEDRPTIRSALRNHGSRINADLMLLLDLEGELIASTGGREREINDPARLVMEDGETTIIALGDNAYQFVTATVRAPLPVARIVTGFRLDEELARDLGGLTGTDVSFLAGGGTERLYATSLDEPDTFSETVLTQVSADGRVRTIDAGQERYLTLARPLPGPEPAPRVLLQTSLDKALAPYRSLWIQLALIAALAFALSLFLAWFLARYVTQPVRALAHSASRISRGDYSEPAPVPRVGELARLGEAFNAMQAGIREREERILHQAYHDHLTGLPNRALAADRLRQGILRVQREGGYLGVLVLDINRFKEINDTLGHPTGDEVLREMARRLTDRVRRSDTVARLGGDEFMVLVHSDSVAGPERLAEAIAEGINKDDMVIGDARLQLGTSIGLAICPDDGDEPETLLRRADIAMYEAKAAQQSLSFYESGRDEAHLRRLRMVSDLRIALKEGQFHLLYQPKVTVSNRRAGQLEALIRWDHPHKGMVSPAEFIPLAERSGHIRDISRWVLEEVIRQCAAWRRDGLDVTVAVNISALDLVDARLPDYVTERLEAHDLDPAALGLEITETTVMQDARHAVGILQGLKDRGIRIAIDDFGTGYSSLAQLRSLPVDELKIDKSFVTKLAGQPEDGEDPVIVRSTIELAHNMGLSVVAEGVEDEATWCRLSRYGCDSIQGFWISRPMAPDTLPDWLDEFRRREWSAPDD